MLQKIKFSNYLLFAFIGIILPVIFVPTSFDPVLFPRLLALSIINLLLVVYYIFISKSQTKRSLNNSFIVPFILGLTYLFFAFISSINAINFHEAISEVIKTGTIVFFFILVSLILNKNTVNIELLLKAIVLYALVVQIIGLYQVIFKVDFSDVFTKDNYLAYYYTKAVLAANSTLANKNLFSSILFLTLPASLYGIAYFKKLWRIGGIISFILAILFISFLVAKAVWVAVIVALLFALVLYFIYYLKNRNQFKTSLSLKIIFIAFVLFLIAGSVFVYKSDNKAAIIIKGKIEQLTDFENLKEENIIKSKKPYSTQIRVLAWYKSFDMFKDHPILGVGPANWRIVLPKYGLRGFGGNIEQGRRNFQRAHSDYIWVLCENGIIGLILYVGLFLWCISIAIKNYFNNSDKRIRILNLWIAGIGFGFAVLSAFDFPKERISHNVLIYSYFAIVVNLSSNQKKHIIKKNAYIIVLYILGLFSAFSVYVSAHRLNGDIKAVNVYNFQFEKKWNRLIRESDKINSTYYNLNPYSMPIKFYQGIGYTFLRKRERANQSFFEAYNQNPYQIEVLNALGSALSMTGNPDSAMVLYKKCLDISPYYIEANMNLASLYYNKRKTLEAYDCIKRIKFNKKNKRYIKIVTTLLKYELSLVHKKPEFKQYQKKILSIYKSDGEIHKMHQFIMKQDDALNEGILNYLRKN